jgi:hypothetical protein
LALTIVQFFSMNEELMLIYLKLHLMPYAIHEMRQYPINVRMFFKIRQVFSLKLKIKIRRKKKKEFQ